MERDLYHMLQVEQFDTLPGSIVYKVILVKNRKVGTYILDLIRLARIEVSVIARVSGRLKFEQFMCSSNILLIVFPILIECRTRLLHCICKE